MKSSSVTIQMKANEQYFPAVLFIMLYKEQQQQETTTTVEQSELTIMLQMMAHSPSTFGECQ